MQRFTSNNNDTTVFYTPLILNRRASLSSELLGWSWSQLKAYSGSHLAPQGILCHNWLQGISYLLASVRPTEAFKGQKIRTRLAIRKSVGCHAQKRVHTPISPNIGREGNVFTFAKNWCKFVLFCLEQLGQDTIGNSLSARREVLWVKICKAGQKRWVINHRNRQSTLNNQFVDDWHGRSLLSKICWFITSAGITDNIGQSGLPMPKTCLRQVKVAWYSLYVSSWARFRCLQSAKTHIFYYLFANDGCIVA